MNEFFHPDSTGGTGTVLSDLARALRGRYEDVEIDVLTSRNLYRGEADALPSAEDWDGVHITRLATPRPNGLPTPLRLGANLLFAGAALLALLRRRRYDLLLVGTAPPTVAIAAQLLKRLTGTPYLYTVYDLEPDCAITLGLLRPDHPLTRTLRRCQKGWLHAAGRAVVLGRCMRDHLGRAYDLPEHRIAVIPVGADPDEIVPRPKDTDFRRRQGLGGFLVCYSGNFGRYHDFDTILDAARRLQTLRDDVTFVLVGDGAQKPHIARRVAGEGLRNVRLFPFVPRDDYADLLASADVSLVTLEVGMEGLCVPSKFYSILASGRPT
ncbi:MAG: glycosyltransferase family 4 protein, partial [Armatimonadetes bacterium]|nr:glycosyltransferase family 4 protein [Armatimonadota bacterium]